MKFPLEETLTGEGGNHVFFHGIPFVHLVRQYPVLAAGSGGDRRSPAQKADARHLEERIGFEPVHLLRSSAGYAPELCLKECLRYGDTVLAFPSLPHTRVRLSRHEWGVARLPAERAVWLLTTRASAVGWLRERFPVLPLVLTRWDGREKRTHRSLCFRP